ncbi:MAG: tetratricopeptide repeat protein [Planctomycetota bacterium]|jgi:tetratricopeptide (TPR) repeat protein
MPPTTGRFADAAAGRRGNQPASGQASDSPSAGGSLGEQAGEGKYQFFAAWGVRPLVLILVVALLLAYWPALQGKFLWDDDAHIPREDLRSLKGLGRIWSEPGVMQQYYPLVQTAFWVQEKLWGEATFGYHMVNLALHVAAAVLLGRILRRLEVPGAYLAAAIFALHPVHVESVAWITELKNTLSGVLYLGAGLVYLRYDQERLKKAYAVSIALFILALMSKTVTATLPAALLVIFWWKRGRLSWRRDVLPLVPFFVLGAGGGLLTAWVERQFIGARGAEFDFTLIERCLIAGRVVWFYLGKLFFPANLIFFYPRWNVSQGVWWQYVYPLAALALVVSLWLLRRRSRAPLAAILFFIGTLFPVLGFFNVYPFRFSLVADHFQYLASVGVISLFSAALVLLFRRLGRLRKAAGVALAGVLLAVLGFLTWRQCPMYSDNETLYRVTLKRNPECWLAHHNLGSLLVDRWEELRKLGSLPVDSGELYEAMYHYKEALRIKEDYFLAHGNLAYVYLLLPEPRLDLAVKHYKRAVDLRWDYPEGHENLGKLLASSDPLRSIVHYRAALRFKPRHPVLHRELAAVLASLRSYEEAIYHYQQALRINPDFVKARSDLGATLAALGRFDDAIRHYRHALRLEPDSPQAHFNLASALAAKGKLDEAIGHYKSAIRLAPPSPHLHFHLAVALEEANQVEAAEGSYRDALALEGDFPQACSRLAWLLATHPALARGDPAEAVRLAEHACRLTGGTDPAALDTLAAAYANHGRFSEAIETAQKAVEKAEAMSLTEKARNIRERLALYRARRPYRRPAGRATKQGAKN